MNIAIIEGNKKSAQQLTQWVKFQHNNHIIGGAICSKSALDLIQKYNPDLILLNTQLKDSSGFDVLEKLVDSSSRVILIGSKESEVLEAKKYNVFDFLAEPINSFSLNHAINRFTQNYNKEDSTQSHEVLKPKMKKNAKIGIPNSTGTQYIPLDNIIYLKAESNYSNIYLEEGKRLLVSKILKLFESKLQKSTFVRVHRSYIVNLEKVIELCNGDGGYLILKNKAKIPVSRTKKKFVMNQLNRHFNSL